MYRDLSEIEEVIKYEMTYSNISEVASLESATYSDFLKKIDSGQYIYQFNLTGYHITNFFFLFYSHYKRIRLFGILDSLWVIISIILLIGSVLLTFIHGDMSYLLGIILLSSPFLMKPLKGPFSPLFLLILDILLLVLVLYLFFTYPFLVIRYLTICFYLPYILTSTSLFLKKDVYLSILRDSESAFLYLFERQFVSVLDTKEKCIIIK